MNPDTVEFTVALSDTLDEEALPSMEDDDFETNTPEFVLRGQITDGKISLHFITGKDVNDNDVEWNKLVDACGQAFGMMSAATGLRSVGFAGEMPVGEYVNADDLEKFLFDLFESRPVG